MLKFVLRHCNLLSMCLILVFVFIVYYWLLLFRGRGHDLILHKCIFSHRFFHFLHRNVCHFGIKNISKWRIRLKLYDQTRYEQFHLNLASCQSLPDHSSSLVWASSSLKWASRSLIWALSSLVWASISLIWAYSSLIWASSSLVWALSSLVCVNKHVRVYNLG